MFTMIRFYRYGLENLRYTSGYNLILFYLFFCTQFSQLWPLGAISVAPVSLRNHFLSPLFGVFASVWFLFSFCSLALPYFLELQGRRPIVHVSSPQSWTQIRHFSPEPWFLLLENRIRDQDLSARLALCRARRSTSKR